MPATRSILNFATLAHVPPVKAISRGAGISAGDFADEATFAAQTFAAKTAARR